MCFIIQPLTLIIFIKVGLDVMPEESLISVESKSNYHMRHITIFTINIADRITSMLSAVHQIKIS